MRRHRFVVPSVVPGAALRLEGPEHAHLSRVLRLGPGDDVFVFDGRGVEAAAAVVRVGREATDLRVGGVLVDPVESPLPVTVVQSLASADRVELAVRRCTELGVTEIVLLRAERTRSSGQARRRPPLARLGRIALESAKQSGRRVVPPVHGPVDPDRIPRPPGNGTAFLLDGAAPTGLVDALDRAGRREAALLAVGPEGGWSAGDRETLEGAGYRAVGLGPRTLRTENAGAAALALVQAAWGDLR